MTIAKTDSQRFFIISAGLIIFLACFYIFQIVKYTETSYFVGEKSELIKELKKETAQLELSVNKDRNLQNLEEKVLEQGFEKVKKLNYIFVSSNVAIAQK
ncbi:MAG: hypothetical protein PHD31_00555 [Candidatus Pacebacteria bacterium]|nr:hypothetical protein [Candidatus Paceibacterota bacterium]